MLLVLSRGLVQHAPSPAEALVFVPDIETVALSFGAISRLVDEQGGKSERIARDEVCDFLRAQRFTSVAFAPPANDARAALAVLAGLVVGSRDLNIAQAFQMVESFIRAKCADEKGAA